MVGAVWELERKQRAFPPLSPDPCYHPPQLPKSRLQPGEGRSLLPGNKQEDKRKLYQEKFTLDIRNKILHGKDCQTLEQAAQGGGGATHYAWRYLKDVALGDMV